MEQLIIILLVGVIIYLLIKGRSKSTRQHTPNVRHKETNLVQRKAPKKNTESASSTSQETTNRRRESNRKLSSSVPSLNTGFPGLDGPGMYHRVHGCGPTGHVCYLLYSGKHKAYKVGICRPENLGIRLNGIKQYVPDVELIGTAVFTTRQNAFDAEQKLIKESSRYRYRGIKGQRAGGSEWFTRKPMRRKPYFTSPESVEEKYASLIAQPLEPLVVPDNYTIYLAYSASNDAYIAKWCKTENLEIKIKKLRKQVSDAKVVARMPVERHEKAREITKKMNEENGSFKKDGRQDVICWSSNPNYLKNFKKWNSLGRSL